MGKDFERLKALDDETLVRIAAAYGNYIRTNGSLNNPGLSEEYEAVKAELARRRAEDKN